MPMPDAGPNFFSPSSSPTNPQPQLLEERRAWVKKDRDVKLDIFLSVADDIKIEVFEVGPPLPPSAMTAKEMMEAMDERFDSFKFEEFHHVFCHFLNLHIDQYATIEDFNAEFLATLDDLLDHGHPMSNTQACSAYFSKLRCTQNPWVVKKLKEWDAQHPEPLLVDLMKQSPPWSIIRPLATSKAPSQQSKPDSIPEETLEDTPPSSDAEDTPSEHSEVATLSSKSSHSRNSSSATQKSQEITVHASYEDLTELQAFPNVPATKLLPAHIPKRMSSMSKLSMQSLPPINRPLPPLPTDAKSKSATCSRSASPNDSTRETASNHELESSLKQRAAQPNSLPKLEQVHPALRTATPTPTSEVVTTVVQSQADIHPALRKSPTTPPPTQTPVPEIQVPTLAAPNGHISSAMRPRTPTPPMGQTAFLSSSPNLAPSFKLAPPSMPDVHQRPQTARSAVTPQPSTDWSQSKPLLRVDSNNSSIISLPLQGTTSTAPEYHDITITESPPTKKQPSKIEMARLRFEGLTGSPPRGLLLPSEEEKKHRKRSWSIKARLSARHGIKEII